MTHTTNGQVRKDRVVVPLGTLIRGDVTRRSLRTDMRLIQAARQARDEHDIEDLHTHMHEHEKEYLSAVFDKLRPECSWTEIADRLGIGLTTLERRRERYGLP